MIVPIRQVIPIADVSRYFINKMKETLQKQGQIEPLQVQKLEAGQYITFDEDAHGNEIVCAAQELGWTTLLIVEMKRYEQ
jgi:hypothetical protein